MSWCACLHIYGDILFVFGTGLRLHSFHFSMNCKLFFLNCVNFAYCARPLIVKGSLNWKASPYVAQIINSLKKLVVYMGGVVESSYITNRPSEQSWHANVHNRKILHWRVLRAIFFPFDFYIIVLLLSFFFLHLNYVFSSSISCVLWIVFCFFLLPATVKFSCLLVPSQNGLDLHTKISGLDVSQIQPGKQEKFLDASTSESMAERSWCELISSDCASHGWMSKIWSYWSELPCDSEVQKNGDFLL